MTTTMPENQNQFKCSGNCLQCSPAQRAYCASQHAYSNMKVLDQIMGMVIGMQGDIKTLSEKVEAIQNNEASVFDPNGENLEIPNLPSGSSEIPTNQDTAQSGDGAESRIPETN